MDVIRYGIIGCGDIAPHTAEAIKKCRNSRLEMVMDVKEDLASDLALKYKVNYTTELDEILGNPSIDAVYIAVPHYLHTPIAIKVAQSKKHILLEKPIATSVADSKKIINTAKRHGIKLCVAMCMRYLPLISKIKRVIDKGLIGKIIGLHIPFFCEKPQSYWSGGFSKRAKTDWRTKVATSGGGILIMNIYHNLDYWLYLSKLKPKEVFSCYDTFGTDAEVEDYISVTIRFKNGAIGSIVSSSVAWGASPEKLIPAERLIGTEGQILLMNYPQPRFYLFTKKKSRGYPLETWNEIMPGANQNQDSRQELIKRFSNALLYDQPPPIPVKEVLETQKICEAAYLSKHSCKPVRVM